MAEGGEVMGRVLNVKDCYKCPFSVNYDYPGGRERFCEHDDGPCLEVTSAKEPPGWCPLRTGPFEVRLDESRVK